MNDKSKDTIIDNNLYKCVYVGELIPKEIDIKAYGISDSLVQEYQKNCNYNNNYDKMIKDKSSYVRQIFSVILTITVIIISVIAYCVYKNKLDIVSIIGMLVMGAIVSTLIYGIAYLFSYIIMPRFLLYLIIKKINPRPKPLDKEKDIITFIEDSTINKKNIYNYVKQYRGIEEYQNDILLYGEQCLKDFNRKVLSFVRVKNQRIEANNKRKEKDWWYQLDPYEFENEVAKWFNRRGYNTEVTPKSGDGGKDIIITKPGYKGYVQCKRYTTSKVDSPTLNALYGVVCADKVSKGIVVCLLGVTPEANEFAKRVGIEILTVDDLAPNDLFHPIVKDKLFNDKIIYNNEHWTKIGPVFVNTTFYQNRDDAQNTIKKWNDRDYRVVVWKNLYWIIKTDDESFDELNVFIDKIEHPTKYSAPTQYKSYKHKKRNKRSYW